MNQEIENHVVQGTESGVYRCIGIFVFHGLTSGRNLLQHDFSLA